jgi:hypothetical protein
MQKGVLGMDEARFYTAEIVLVSVCHTWHYYQQQQQYQHIVPAQASKVGLMNRPAELLQAPVSLTRASMGQTVVNYVVPANDKHPPRLAGVD